MSTGWSKRSFVLAPRRIPHQFAGQMFRAGLLAVAILLSAGAVRADWDVVLHEGRRHVTLQSLANFYGLQVKASQGGGFVLTSANKTIRGATGAREIFINNVKLILCFPLVTRGNTTLISAMDVTKIIEPVMRPGKIKDAGALRTVVLDAGHGGHDSGATSVYGKEKDFTLDVALRARKLLQENGYTVRMSRTTDVFVPLENRAAMANRYPAALFVSIHFNKSRSDGASGIETYALAPRGVPSMDEENVSYTDLRQNPGNVRDSENIALATLIHSAMLRNLRLYDRGIKRARFVVIRDVTIPGVLIEGGFVNSPVDGRAIASPEYRQRMASSILEAVQNYKRLVAGQAVHQKPSLVVTPIDSVSGSPTPTPVPVAIPTPPPELSNAVPAPAESPTPPDAHVHLTPAPTPPAAAAPSVSAASQP